MMRDYIKVLIQDVINRPKAWEWSENESGRQWLSTKEPNTRDRVTFRSGFWCWTVYITWDHDVMLTREETVAIKRAIKGFIKWSISEDETVIRDKVAEWLVNSLRRGERNERKQGE